MGANQSCQAKQHGLLVGKHLFPEGSVFAESYYSYVPAEDKRVEWHVVLQPDGKVYTVACMGENGVLYPKTPKYRVLECTVNENRFEVVLDLCYRFTKEQKVMDVFVKRPDGQIYNDTCQRYFNRIDIQRRPFPKTDNELFNKFKFFYDEPKPYQNDVSHPKPVDC